MNQKKVGVLTYHFIRNYGACLQAYCLVKAIREMGHECVILDFRLEPKTTFLEKIKRQVKKILKPKARIPSIHSDLMLDFLRRQNVLGSAVCHTVKQLEQAAAGFDVVVVGSDEIWNFENIFGRQSAYMGDFHFGGTRISYAPSFGNHSPIGGPARFIRRLLMDFKHLSVRDAHSAEVAYSLTSKPVKIVPDPTFLVDIPGENASQGPYILTAGHLNPQQAASVIEFGKRKKLPVLSVGHRHEGIECLDINITPELWYAHIKGASYVVSTLFHASILALKNGVPFAVFDSVEKRVKLRAMLENFQVPDALLPAAATPDDIDAAFSKYPSIDPQLVASIRRTGREYLEYALG